VNTEGRAQLTRAAVAPLQGAREDWKIIRALSQVMDVSLPYDTIEELRGRMRQVSPTLIDYDHIEPTPSGISKTGLEQFLSSSKTVSAIPFKLCIQDFYLTNSISRASSTMAKCSQVHL
jgi:NADH dehydrogenase (ubiquinone) Fe-S protein 1